MRPWEMSKARRRLVTCPTIAVIALAGTLMLPLIVPLAIAADLVRLRRRLPLARVLLFVVAYAWIDLAAQAALAWLWVRLGFGLAIGTRRGQELHRRVQKWWVRVVTRTARRTVGLRFTVEGVDQAAPGPAIVIGRHVSYGDALLPPLLTACHHDLTIRYVLMRELMAVPALDICGLRLRNHFVNRSTPDETGDIADLRCLVADLEDDALIIFPEGRFRTPARFHSSIERLRTSDPDRAERVAQLRHLLPVRPRGMLALLETAPQADIVVVAHAGLEGFSTVAEFVRNAPIAAPVRVKVTRIAAADVPTNAADRVAWLDDRWREVDRWISEASPRSAAVS